MAEEVDASIHLQNSSLSFAERTLVKAVYLKRLKKVLESEPDKVVLWLNSLRGSLFAFQNLRLLVTANLETLPEPLKAWDTLSDLLIAPDRMDFIVKPSSLLSEEGKNTGSVGVTIVPMATLESSFSIITSPRVGSYYLETGEGPLWNASVAQATRTEHRHRYHFYRVPASRDAIRRIVNGGAPMDRHPFGGAVSNIVTMFAEEQSTLASAAQRNFVHGVIRDLPKDWGKETMRKVRGVSVEEIKGIMDTLILPFFKPGKSNVVVACSKLMTEGMEMASRGMAYKVETRELSHFHDDYGLGDDENEEGEGYDDELEGPRERR